MRMHDATAPSNAANPSFVMKCPASPMDRHTDHVPPFPVTTNQYFPMSSAICIPRRSSPLKNAMAIAYCFKAEFSISRHSHLVVFVTVSPSSMPEKFRVMACRLQKGERSHYKRTQSMIPLFSKHLRVLSYCRWWKVATSHELQALGL